MRRFVIGATAAISFAAGATGRAAPGPVRDQASTATKSSSEPRRLTLAAALAYAHEHNPDLAAASARLASVESRADIVRAHWYPVMGASAQIVVATTNNTTSSYLSVPSFDDSRVSATPAESPVTASWAPSASSLIGAGVRQEIFDFGRLTAKAAAEDLRADAERCSLASRRLLVDYDVEEAYFAVYAAKSVLAASDEAHARAVVHRDMAKAGVALGLRRPIELTRAEAVVDDYDLARIQGRRGVIVAQSVFAVAVGAPEPLLDIDGAPPAPAEIPSLSDAFEQARAHNPELRAALLALRMQQQETRAISAETRPNLYLSAAISGNAGGGRPSSGESAPGGGFAPVVPNWDVALVLSWSLFDETVVVRERQSRHDEDAFRAETDATTQKITGEVERAFVDAEAAHDAVPVRKHLLDAAIANYDQASARFSVGMGNAVELADAEALRTDAQIRLALGTFDLARSRAALGRVIAEAP